MKRTQFIAKMGILFALACALQFLESLIPLPLPLGVKAGISSIVIMYILLEMGFVPALTTAVLKSCFVFATRSFSAFCMSVCGGIVSVLAMEAVLLIYRKSRKGTGIAVFSAVGGVFHNIGQLCAASLLAGSLYTISYVPVLITAGIISGFFTGTLLRLVLEALSRSRK